MAVEIERKFLVAHDDWRDGVQGTTRIVQGYLAADDTRSARVRIRNGSATLTIKGEQSVLTRAEFEYEIPVDDAEGILELCLQPVLEKQRSTVDHAGHVWEIDVFEGANEGLVVAEVELESEHEQIDLPTWLGAEVTNDRRYTNAYLARRPYRTWDT